ncbi:hypothetical protein [Nocardia sp. NPDC049149]|uniref:hypothetical protein n=1 Tax=Nocardia sp. NPDC049149 TaxID=3364315 RepID=UPI003719C9DA
MANVDAVRLSNELGIDLAHAMLRLRREGRPGESNHDTCLRIIADEARPKREPDTQRARPTADGTFPAFPPHRPRRTR